MPAAYRLRWAGMPTQVLDVPWPIATLKRAAGVVHGGDWIETPYITDEGIRLIQTAEHR